MVEKRGLNNIFEITVKYEEDGDRPKKGWRIFYHTPDGIQPFLSRRKKNIKFRSLYDALKWVSQHRPGYKINLIVECYTGELRQKRKTKKT